MGVLSLRPVAALVLLMAASGCTADAAGPPTAKPATTPAFVTAVGPTPVTPTTALVAFPRGPDDLLIEIDTTTGYWDPNFEVLDLPTLTVFGDGSIYRSGPSELTPTDGHGGYPSANEIRTITRTVLPAEELEELMQLADRLGMFRSRIDFGEAAVFDGSRTTMRIDLPDSSVSHEVPYAGDVQNAPDSDGAQNLAAAQQFLAALYAAGESGATPYVPEAVIVNRWRPTPEAKPKSFGPPATQRWPVDTVPRAPEEGQSHTCTVVDGDEVAPLLAALADATATTAWTTPDGTMDWVQFRPAFPGGFNGC